MAFGLRLRRRNGGNVVVLSPQQLEQALQIALFFFQLQQRFRDQTARSFRPARTIIGRLSANYPMPWTIELTEDNRFSISGNAAGPQVDAAYERQEQINNRLGGRVVALYLAAGAEAPADLTAAMAAAGFDPLVVAMDTADAYNGLVAEVEALGLWDPAPRPDGAPVLMVMPFGFRWIASGADFNAWLPEVEEIEDRLIPMLPLTLFYSWQMDRPTHVCRDFIRKALDEAAAILDASGEIALTIDSDTQGEPGTPPITDTILKKIRLCDIFLADMTFVAQAGEKLIPNPNVMGEYGYALHAKGTPRILLVMIGTNRTQIGRDHPCLDRDQQHDVGEQGETHEPSPLPGDARLLTGEAEIGEGQQPRQDSGEGQDDHRPERLGPGEDRGDVSGLSPSPSQGGDGEGERGEHDQQRDELQRSVHSTPPGVRRFRIWPLWRRGRRPRPWPRFRCSATRRTTAARPRAPKASGDR